MALTATEIRSLLAGPPAMLRDSAFDVLTGISALGASDTEKTSRELLIRALDRRDVIDGATPLLTALVRQHGLFPYLPDPDRLGTADRIAYEIHRPIGTDDLVFHAKQAEVYRLLADGHNVVLSAPTSFGKSLIIDAIIATGIHRTIVLIVPTIALIDETRRRLSRRFRSQYKIITHPAQPPAERNIYVLTQERLLDIPNSQFPHVSFFVIDEFYKLDSAHDEERMVLLNHAFRRLHATGAQFYLLGPNIDGLAKGVHDKLQFQFISTDFQTVTLDTEFQDVGKHSLQEAVANRCRTLRGPTLLYVRSPNRAREVARWLLDAGLGQRDRDLDDAADWVAGTYHPQWMVARALRNGIGVHHGKMPRALAHHIVRLFNNGRLPWLIVTSTLIEGVNTIAENVIIVDNKVATRNLDFFTYSNIRGRSGRMFKHFVGKVIVYGEPPADEKKTVDIPAYSQRSGTPTSLLIQLPWNELTQASRDRLEPLYRQQAVTIDTIREATGVDPQKIVDVASMLHENPAAWSARLTWSGRPTYDQLKTACRFVYQLSGGRSRNGVSSADQLAMRIDLIRRHQGRIRPLAEAQMQFDAQRLSKEASADQAVENVLDFIRGWPGHQFPRLLIVLQAITEDVFRRHSLPAGDYRHYAAVAEALFRQPILTTLEEYGLPAPLTARLLRFLSSSGQTGDQVDEVLENLRHLPVIAGLSRFESDMLRDTIANL